MFYLLQLWKAILSKSGVRNLARNACDVNGCVEAACEPSDLPPGIRRLRPSLCKSHLESLLGSIEMALAEAEKLQIPPLEELITLTELRELLFPTGNPRLHLLEQPDASESVS